MKKTIAVLLSIIFIVGLVGSVGAAAKSAPPMFKVNGKLFVTPNGEPAPYINKDGRTMGSLRLIAAALGVESKDINWDKTKQTATLTRGKHTVAVIVGKKEITVNGSKVTMDTVAEMKQGRVFIPARFIAQGLGATIGYEAANNTVLIYTGKAATNNFEDYGLKAIVEFPVVMEYGGLELTVHEAYIYPTNAKEAIALDTKYDLWKFEDANYLLWTKVTLTNNSKKDLYTDYRSMLMKIGAVNGEGNSLFYSTTWLEKYSGVNNTEMLYDWVLKPNESITSYIPFLDLENKKLEFIGISVRTESGNTYKDLAEKVK